MAEQTPRLRLGFIGGHGHHYLRGALEDEQVAIEQVAVAGDGRDPHAARKQFAQVLPEATWFDDPVEMLDAFQPTLVSVGGVYARKTDLLIEAMGRNIPVVADKPVAASWEALDRLRAAAADRTLLTEFSFRGTAPFLAAKAAIAAGEIGEVVLATVQKSYRFGNARPDFYRNRDDYGSTMLWVASHGIDAIRFITDLTFRTVAAAHGNVSKADYRTMEDHCAALFTMNNGATALVHADFLRPAAAATHGDDRVRIAGGRGVVEVRDGRCLLTTDQRAQQDITDLAVPEPIHRRLLDAALHGDTRWYSTRATLEVAAVLLAARDAADTGRIVTIDAPAPDEPISNV